MREITVNKSLAHFRAVMDRLYNQCSRDGNRGWKSSSGECLSFGESRHSNSQTEDVTLPTRGSWSVTSLANQSAHALIEAYEEAPSTTRLEFWDGYLARYSSGGEPLPSESIGPAFAEFVDFIIQEVGGAVDPNQQTPSPSSLTTPTPTTGLPQDELSRRIDQRITLLLATLITPPNRWTYVRQDSPPIVAYIFYLSGVESGRLILPYTLTNSEHLTLIATARIRGRQESEDGSIPDIEQQRDQEFRQLSHRLLADLKFWHKTIWHTRPGEIKIEQDELPEAIEPEPDLKSKNPTVRKRRKKLFC